MASRKKKSKTSKKTRTRRRDFPPLKSASAQHQLETLQDATADLLKVVEETNVVPIGYMRHVFSSMTNDFRSNLKARRVDPVERKKARLHAKIAKLQEELANTDK